MSYARFGADGSAVYVFMSVDGVLECCGCALPGPGGGGSFTADGTEEMIGHLAMHVEAGQAIPAGLVSRLRADDAENFPSAGGGPSVL